MGILDMAREDVKAGLRARVPWKVNVDAEAHRCVQARLAAVGARVAPC